MERRIRKRGGDYCSATGCHNSRNNCSLSFFGFPKDEERSVNDVAYFGKQSFPQRQIDPYVSLIPHTQYTNVCGCDTGSITRTELCQ